MSVKLCAVSHVVYWPGLLTLLLDSKREKISQVFSGTEYPYLKIKIIIKKYLDFWQKKKCKRFQELERKNYTKLAQTLTQTV